LLDLASHFLRMRRKRQRTPFTSIVVVKPFVVKRRRRQRMLALLTLGMS
jgi:hypothetical protein